MYDCKRYKIAMCIVWPRLNGYSLCSYKASFESFYLQDTETMHYLYIATKY